MTRRLLSTLLSASFLTGVLAALLAGTPTATAGFCDPFAQDLTTGGNVLSNTQDPTMGIDQQWKLLGGPGTPAGAAYSIQALSPPWVADPANANWISPWASSAPGGYSGAPVSATSNGMQPYVYQTSFVVDEASFDEVALDLQFAADDVIEFYLNGQPIGSAGIFTQKIGFTQWHALSVTDTLPGPGPFVDGVNVLEARVQNYLFWTGFIAIGSVVQSCDPCAFTNDITTGSTDGTANAFGVDDDEWVMTTIASSPTPAEPSPYSVSVYPGWLTPPSGTWISPVGASSGTAGRSAPVGTYSYTLRFEVRCEMAEYQLCQIDFAYAADNNVEIYLNNVLIAGPRVNAFSTTAAVTYSDCLTFQAGTNVLEARVWNGGGPTGFYLAGAIDMI